MDENTSFTIQESVKAKTARETLDKIVGEALLRHTENHLTIFGEPLQDWEEIFNEAVAAGYYNGKTVTYKTPKGTITFHAEVGAPCE